MATPRKEKPKEEPGYCKTADLTKMFDLTSQWINQLTRDGVLKKHRTAAGSRYNTVEATRSYCKSLREKAAGREKKETTADQETQKLEAEIRMKNAKADIAEMEAKELSGQMHCSEDVEAMTTDLVYAIRGMLVALPGRLAVDVVQMKTAAEAADYIRKEIANVLLELQNYKYDPAKYAQRVRERKKWADRLEDGT